MVEWLVHTIGTVNENSIMVAVQRACAKGWVKIDHK